MGRDAQKAMRSIVGSLNRLYFGGRVPVERIARFSWPSGGDADFLAETVKTRRGAESSYEICLSQQFAVFGYTPLIDALLHEMVHILEDDSRNDLGDDGDSAHSTDFKKESWRICRERHPDAVCDLVLDAPSMSGDIALYEKCFERLVSGSPENAESSDGCALSAAVSEWRPYPVCRPSASSGKERTGADGAKFIYETVRVSGGGVLPARWLTAEQRFAGCGAESAPDVIEWKPLG